MSIETERIFDALDGVQRPVRTVINIALAVVIGLLLARIFWFIVAPAAAGATTVAGDLPRPLVETKSTLVVDRTVLFKKNFFETSEKTIVIAEDAPETNLNLILEGVAAPSTAYIVLPNKEKKRFKPGDIITNGVELVSIESDRVVLSRDGGTEVLLRNPDQQSNIVPYVEGQEQQLEEVSAPVVLTATGTRDQFIANVDIKTVKRAEVELLQFFPKNSGEEFARLNFQPGDILLEAGGIQGARFDDLAELVSEKDNVIVMVERAGEPVQINIRFVQ